MSDFVTNPLTNRPVRVGSVVYQRLVKKGLISESGNNEPVSKAYKELPTQMRQPPSKPIKVPNKSKSASTNYYADDDEEYYDAEELSSSMETHYKKPMQTLARQTNKERQANKVKKPLDIKINSILESGCRAYKETMRNIPPDMTDEQLENFIREDLIKNLKNSGNKYLQKYL